MNGIPLALLGCLIALRKSRRSAIPRLRRAATVLFVAGALCSTVGAQSVNAVSSTASPIIPYTAAAARDLVATLKTSDAVTESHRKTGRTIFVGSKPGRTVNASLPPAARPLLPPRPVAADYLNLLGPAFGLDNPGPNVRVVKTRADNRLNHTRYQQTHNGLPVIGGEIIVNLDAAGNLLSMSGKTAPNLVVDTTPLIAAGEAQKIALAAIAKWRMLDANRLIASRAELSVFYPPIVDGAGTGPARPVWRLEVKARQTDPVRELMLVDAQTGAILLHFNQIDAARNRLTYDANSTASLPGTLVCNEANSTCNSIADAVKAHQFAADTYDYYQSHFNRDSINNAVNNAGMTIVSTVRACPAGESCPYANAYWDGAQMVYGAGFASADDVVAHELTHGVTEYESNLFYYYQSGAINEALSDIFGEFVDQANGRGTDTAGVMWLLGEDLSIGAIRSMANPLAYSDPDKMTSSYYYRGEDDNGGVHWNSGIANKAAYLMAAGGTFNGKTIAPLGNDKTAAIWYEAQVNLLWTSSDYLDLYNAMYQACTNLAGGVAGVTAADCEQVRNATDAVEMNLEPVSGFMPEATTCPSGSTATTIFSDNLDSGPANWTRLGDLTDRWGYSIWSASTGYARSEPIALYGFDPGERYDASVATYTAVAIPASAYLRFEHAFGFDHYSTAYYDGGVVEYSINNGGTWAAMTPDSGQGYGGTISSSYGNPLGGRSAFVGASHGYVSSRFNLGTLAGQSARFRFRIGADDSVGDLGWVIDNVQIYTCTISVSVPSATTGSATSITATGATLGGTVTSNGASTTVSFQYGLTASYDSTITAAQSPLVASASGAAVSAAVTGLSCGTTYHFRGVATNSAGTTDGSDATFTTGACPAVPAVQFGSATYSVNESVGSVTIPVTRSRDTGTSTVNYATANGTATAGSDYPAKSGTLTFAAGVTSQNIVVTISNDKVAEVGETFTVTLSNPGNAVLGTPSTTTVTIVDNDSGTALTNGQAVDALAGARGSSTYFNIEVPSDMGSLTVTTSGGTGNVDLYVRAGALPTTSTYTCRAITTTNADTCTVNAPTAGRYYVMLRGTSAYSGVSLMATYAPPSVKFGAATYSVMEGTPGVTIPVTRSGSPTNPVTVDYATADGTATAGADYTATSGTLTFAAGVATQNIVVPITNDPDIESGETFTVTLSNASGVVLGTPSTTTVTIADDDTPPTVQFSTSEVSVNDTVGTVTFTVTRLSRATTTASVKYATANGTAIAGTDYAAKTGTLSWAAGDATAKTFTVSIKNRSGTQAPRSFTVNLNTPTNVGVGTPATATVTILN